MRGESEEIKIRGGRWGAGKEGGIRKEGREGIGEW